jgi:hypothetical protein
VVPRVDVIEADVEERRERLAVAHRRHHDERVTDADLGRASGRDLARGAAFIAMAECPMMSRERGTRTRTGQCHRPVRDIVARARRRLRRPGIDFAGDAMVSVLALVRGRGRRVRAGAAALAVGAALVTLGVTRSAPAGEYHDVSFSDDFDRAPGPVGAGWSALRGDWSIRAGSAVAGGRPERVLADDGLTVAAAFRVTTTLTLAVPAGTGRSWAGVATNIVNHGDGTQSFYSLRVGQRAADGNTALWQLVRIDHSASADESSLLAGGGVTAPPGTTLQLTVESAARGTALAVRVTGSGVANPVDRTVGLRQLDRLAGGQAGLYSQDGTMPLLGFAMLTTTQPAYVSFVDDFQRADGPVGNGWEPGRGAWSIVQGVAVPAGTSERVMYPRGITLGSTFVLRASLALPATPPGYRPWAGIAFNLRDNGDGTQTYYVLRVGQAQENGNTALWQVLRMNRSVATLLKAGSLTAPPGSRLNLSVVGRNRGTGVELGITGAGLVPVDQYVGFPLGDILAGGRAGLYSNQGSVGLDNFSLDTTTEAANPPTGFVPLDCSPTARGDYPLPSANETVDPEVVEVDHTWAGQSVGQEILTSGNDQYVAYYNASRVMTVAKRTLPSTTWTYRALDSVLGWDSHNYVTMALDSTGNLHVAGDMHAVPLVYFRTTRPGDIATLTRVPTMVDAGVENSVTYPRFFTDPAGTLMFSYRNGASGDGSTYYDRYDTVSRTWSSLLSTPLTNGEGLRSAYEEGPSRGPDGFYHLGLVWRDTPDAGSSSMPSYLRSPDLVHWQDSAGNPVALPATYATADVIDPVPIDGGVLNGYLKLGFDAAGKLVMTYAKYDENLTNQLYAARPDGHGGWRSVQLTHWTGRWEISGAGSLGNVPFQLRRGASPLPDGNLRIDYQCGATGRSLVVNPDSLAVVADVPTPQLPPAITTVQSDFPGMGVRYAFSPTSSGRYVLRWESLGPHNDLPLPPESTPSPQPLRVYFLRTGSAG